MEYAFAYRFFNVSERNGKTMENYRILVINPGSTSTKVGVFEGETCLYEGTVRHSREELDKFPGIIDQAPMRMELIKSQLKENNIDLASIDGFIGRGGIVKPMLSGTYTVMISCSMTSKTCHPHFPMPPASAEYLQGSWARNTINPIYCRSRRR